MAGHLAYPGFEDLANVVGFGWFQWLSGCLGGHRRRQPGGELADLVLVVVRASTVVPQKLALIIRKLILKSGQQFDESWQQRPGYIKGCASHNEDVSSLANCR